MQRLLIPFFALVMSGSAAVAQTITLTYLVDDIQTDSDSLLALVDAYMKQHPDVTIQVELRPGGADGDNIVKTRLATGDMTDLFSYNAGSLLQALHPSETLVDLSGQPFMSNVVDSFKPTVSQGEAVYGVPTQTGMGGGMLYNKAVFQKLGLEVPKTWDQFVANNKKIADAGITPVAASFASGNTWTAQLFVLADYYNVQQEEPGFAEKYTANKIDIATDPAALAGFQHLQQGHDLSWWQKDAATATYDDAIALLATGQAAQYSMLTFALSEIQKNFPDQVDDIGFFAQPGNVASNNGVTMWMPPAAYLFGKMLMAMISAAMVIVLLLGLAVGVAHVSLTLGQAAALLLTGTLGVLPFCALGMLVGTMIKGQGARTAANRTGVAELPPGPHRHARAGRHPRADHATRVGAVRIHCRLPMAGRASPAPQWLKSRRQYRTAIVGCTHESSGMVATQVDPRRGFFRS